MQPDGWIAQRSWGDSERLGELEPQVLLVHGDRDSGVPGARVEGAARQLPDARLVVVPDAGHWVQRRRPDLVLAALAGFLDELG